VTSTYICMRDGRTCSHAIMRYLCQTRKIADHWYPSDAKERVVVDSVLDWHHTYDRLPCTLIWVHDPVSQRNPRAFRWLRQGAAGLVFSSLLAPMRGITVTEPQLKQIRATLAKSLKVTRASRVGGGALRLHHD